MSKNYERELHILKKELKKIENKYEFIAIQLKSIKESSDSIIDKLVSEKDMLEKEEVGLKGVLDADFMKNKANKVLYSGIIDEIMGLVTSTAENGGYSVVLQRGIKNKSDDCLYSLYDVFVVDYFESLGYKFIWLIDDYHEEGSHKIADTYKLAISWK